MSITLAIDLITYFSDVTSKRFFDPNESAQAKVLMFGVHPDYFPLIENMGDIVFLRRVECRIYQGKSFLGLLC